MKLPGPAVFAVDLRSLAALRIGLAFALLADLLERSRDFTAHYTDAGIYPLSAFSAEAGSSARFTLHYWVSGSQFLEGLLFVAAAAAAIGLMLGVRTRLMTVLSWFLLVSLQVRSGVISTMGADKLLRLLLFWGMFLPLGARYSVDLWRTRAPSGVSNRLVSMPAAALLVQVALVYWVTGYKKSDPSWGDGTAVLYALQLKMYVTAPGIWLRDYEGLVAILTHATRAFELLGPFLAFSPWAHAPLRSLAILAFWGFHLSLGLFLDIGLFPLIAIIGWLAFIPGAVWDAVLGVAKDGRDERPMWKTSHWTQIGSAAVLAYILLFLLVQVAPDPVARRLALPSAVTKVGSLARLHQSWGMFAPAPVKEPWIRFEGVAEDRKRIDWTPTDAPPGLPSSRYSLRWRLWMTNITVPPSRSEKYANRHRMTQQYICRTWNAKAAPSEQFRRVRTIRTTDWFDREIPTKVEVLYEAPCVSSATARD